MIRVFLRAIRLRADRHTSDEAAPDNAPCQYSLSLIGDTHMCAPSLRIIIVHSSSNMPLCHFVPSYR
jgi:hypothetical protein